MADVQLPFDDAIKAVAKSGSERTGALLRALPPKQGYKRNVDLRHKSVSIIRAGVGSG